MPRSNIKIGFGGSPRSPTVQQNSATAVTTPIMKLIVTGTVACPIIVKGEMFVTFDAMIIIVATGEIVCVSAAVKRTGTTTIIVGIRSLVVTPGTRSVNDTNGVPLEFTITV